MSDCQDALHELYGFLDGELTEDRRVAIQHHLDTCQPCAEPYDFEAELRAVVRRKCQEQVPDADGEDPHGARVGGLPPHGLSRRRRPRPAGCASRLSPSLPGMRSMLAVVWHYWIGVALVLGAVGTLAALAFGYLTKVESTRYPKKGS